MTFGSPFSVPIMRPLLCRTVLHVSILAVLILTASADGDNSECEVVIRVHRNTVYEALSGEHLRINCNVSFCNETPPTVSWYKLENTYVPVNISSGSHIKTEWRLLNKSEGISYLFFQQILTNDSGKYRCQSEGSMGHGINVIVHDDLERSNDTERNETKNPSLDSKPKVDLWLYVYTAAGIGTFVILVIIISIASMRGCKGKSKKETSTENQYAVVPMVEQPFRNAPQHPTPRGSPCVTLSRGSPRRNARPSGPGEMQPPGDSTTEARARQAKVVEVEEGSVVYAALNHQLPTRVTPRLQRPQQESSEYAAIRIKDPTQRTRH